LIRLAIERKEKRDRLSHEPPAELDCTPLSERLAGLAIRAALPADVEASRP
jgi:hypothetical protein